MGGSEDTERLIPHMKVGVLWFGSTDPGVSCCFCLRCCVEQQKVRQGFGRKIHSGSVTACGGVSCLVQLELLPTNLLEKCKEIFI